MSHDRATRVTRQASRALYLSSGPLILLAQVLAARFLLPLLGTG